MRRLDGCGRKWPESYSSAAVIFFLYLLGEFNQ